MSALYIVRAPPDFVQHIVTLPDTALCYVCAAKVMMCVDHH